MEPQPALAPVAAMGVAPEGAALRRLPLSPPPSCRDIAVTTRDAPRCAAQQRRMQPMPPADEARPRSFRGATWIRLRLQNRREMLTFEVDLSLLATPAYASVADDGR